MHCPVCKQVFGKGVQRCPLHGRKLVEDDSERSTPIEEVVDADPHDSEGATLMGLPKASGDPLIGRRFNERFVVEAKIGEGGMGIVYRGSDLEKKEPIAIKVLKAQESDELGLEARFKREAKLIAKLSHPSTIRFVDWGSAPDGTLFMVTELLTGQPLDKLLEQNPNGLGQALTVEIIDQVAASLEDAHALGVIHRDLKPANVFVDGNRAKLLDFGIARIATTGIELSHTFAAKTQAGLSLFTPMYCSPEQAVGDELDQRSDIYSLGVLAYHCLSGKTPFKGGLAALVEAHLSKGAPSIKERNPAAEVTPELEELVRQMMEKLPTKRVQTVTEVRERLAVIRGGDAPTRLDLHRRVAPEQRPTDDLERDDLERPTPEIPPPPTLRDPPPAALPRWVIGLMIVAVIVFALGVTRALWPSNQIRSVPLPEESR
jgi:serine/threonine-protein kinase